MYIYVYMYIHSLSRTHTHTHNNSHAHICTRTCSRASGARRHSRDGAVSLAHTYAHTNQPTHSTHTQVPKISEQVDVANDALLVTLFISHTH